MDYFDVGLPFCSNPQCPLHVRAGDACVRGSGNWAVMPTGGIVGRGIYDGAYLCDPCGRKRIAPIDNAASA